MVLFLVTFVASGLWTYISIKPQTRVNPVRESSLVITPEYRIISRKALQIWPEGTVFEQGRAAYFMAAEPEIEVIPRVEVTGFVQGIVNGTIRSRVILQVVNDKSQAYWSYLLSETKEEAFTLSEGMSNQESRSVYTANKIVLDAVLANDLVTQISEELMFMTGLFQMVVVSDIHMVGEVNGNPIDKTIIQELPVTLQQIYFTLPKSEEIASEITVTGAGDTTERKNASPMEIVRNNLLQISITLISAFMLIIVLPGRTAKSKAAAEHRRFKEWITEGSVEIKDWLNINILSLEGLVDLAIDLDKRVIYDVRIHKYYVLTEDIVYVYDPERKSSLMDSRQQLGKLLLDSGLIEPEQLEIGLYHQKKTGRRLGESLIALGFINETTLYSILAAQSNINYYELVPEAIMKNLGLLNKMGIHQARALMAIPLGVMVDGRIVVASSEASNEGVKNALQEIFDSEVVIVATKPSSIFEVLKRVKAVEKEKINSSLQLETKHLEPYERLNEEELKQVISSFYRGRIDYELLLKASGIDPIILNQVPEKEDQMVWLVNKNIISGEEANLMKGLDKLIETMDRKSRNEKILPDLPGLLYQSNYLTKETLDWVRQEQSIEELPVKQILMDNFLASYDTVQNAEHILSILDSILNKS